MLADKRIWEERDQLFRESEAAVTGRTAYAQWGEELTHEFMKFLRPNRFPQLIKLVANRQLVDHDLWL